MGDKALKSRAASSAGAGSSGSPAAAPAAAAPVQHHMLTIRRTFEVPAHSASVLALVY